MTELILTAELDDKDMIHLQLPPGTAREVEVIVRDKPDARPFKPNGPAILEAIRNLPPKTEEDAKFWREAREELFRDRDEWDDD